MSRRHTTTVRRGVGNEDAPLTQDALRAALLDMAQYGSAYVASERHARQVQAAAVAARRAVRVTRLGGGGWRLDDEGRVDQ
jgi:hypothetical protein